MKRRKLGRWLMGAGLFLLLAAAGLVLWNGLEARRGEEFCAQALEPVRACQQRQAALYETAPLPAETLALLREMPVAEIDGRAYVGTVEIPALGLTLPVLNEWDYNGLRLAPCRYSGSVYTADLVVCAHSYRSHFGRLNQLRPGDEVIFTCMDGAAFVYRVAAVEVLAPVAVEEMTDSAWPLTLFTCTTDSRARVTVRCELAEN